MGLEIVDNSLMKKRKDKFKTIQHYELGNQSKKEELSN
jgi:hypothetical protein